jgi:hypothetical protein
LSSGALQDLGEEEPDEDDRGAVTAKLERTGENQQLIEAVFVDLAERKPQRFTYNVFWREDDVSFIHVVIEHDVQEPGSLQVVLGVSSLFGRHRRALRHLPPAATGATICRRLPLLVLIQGTLSARMSLPSASRVGPT